MELKCKIYDLNHSNECNIIYPQEVLERAVQNYNDKDYRFGHFGYKNTQNIELPLISHEVKDVKIDGENFNINVELLDTENGIHAKELINAGAELHIKPRLLINKEKVKRGPGKYTGEEVITDMDIVSFDLVYEK